MRSSARCQYRRLSSRVAPLTRFRTIMSPKAFARLVPLAFLLSAAGCASLMPALGIGPDASARLAEGAAALDAGRYQEAFEPLAWVMTRCEGHEAAVQARLALAALEHSGSVRKAGYGRSFGRTSGASETGAWSDYHTLLEREARRELYEYAAQLGVWAGLVVEPTDATPAPDAREEARWAPSYPLRGAFGGEMSGENCADRE
jgi:hypothetical protein